MRYPLRHRGRGVRECVCAGCAEPSAHAWVHTVGCTRVGCGAGLPMIEPCPAMWGTLRLVVVVVSGSGLGCC